MVKTCPECGNALPPRTPGKRGAASTFCCNEHKTVFQNRQAVQGRTIIAMAKAWRVSRNRKEDAKIGREALTEMCAILDSFIAEDRTAGRPRPTEYAAAQLASGYRFIDRKRA